MLFYFLWFSLWGQPGQKSSLFNRFFFLIYLILIIRFMLFYLFIYSFIYLLSFNQVFKQGLADLFLSLNPKEFYMPHSPWQILFHTFAITINFTFLHSYQCITIPTHSCLVFYSYSVNFLHSVRIWLIASSLSQVLLYYHYYYLFHETI